MKSLLGAHARHHLDAQVQAPAEAPSRWVSLLRCSSVSQARREFTPSMAGGAPEVPISARPFLRGGEEIAWLYQ
jgi:hypothetical protein